MFTRASATRIKTRVSGLPMLKLVILHHFSKNIESLKKSRVAMTTIIAILHVPKI